MSNLRLEPEVIEGIGTTYGAALRDAGITTLGDLLRKSADRISSIVPDISTQTASKWLAAAELLQIDGVDANTAEAFIDAGVTSTAELADAGLQTLERAMSSALEAGKIPEGLSAYKLADVQREAGKLIGTGIVFGRVTDRDDNPYAGAIVRIPGKSTTVDDSGRFEFESVTAGNVKLSFELPDGRTPSVRTTVESRKVARFNKLAMDAVAEGYEPVVLRESEGTPIMFAKGCRFYWIDRALEDLPGETAFMVQKVDDSGTATLDHVYRTKVARRIEIDRVTVEAARLPADSARGTVLHYKDGEFTLSTETVGSLRRKILEDRLGVTLTMTGRRRVVKTTY